MICAECGGSGEVKHDHADNQNRCVYQHEKCDCGHEWAIHGVHASGEFMCRSFGCGCRGRSEGDEWCDYGATEPCDCCGGNGRHDGSCQTAEEIKADQKYQEWKEEGRRPRGRDE